ncbi:hypothetical protein [Methanosarcina mazei]|uniref:hypothetical protein n=1 Tax=Methanosarcina mazei TaxID=2209 RepID=UPI000B116D3C|nr:hypothetical protein [Methanosarcina mazei]
MLNFKIGAIHYPVGIFSLEYSLPFNFFPDPASLQESLVVHRMIIAMCVGESMNIQGKY